MRNQDTEMKLTNNHHHAAATSSTTEENEEVEQPRQRGGGLVPRRPSSGNSISSSSFIGQGGLDHVRLPFAYKLHMLLCDMENNGCEDIISWVEDGNAFKVHDQQRFQELIQPRYFRQSKITSFIRQVSSQPIIFPQLLLLCLLTSVFPFFLFCFLLPPAGATSKVLCIRLLKDWTWTRPWVLCSSQFPKEQSGKSIDNPTTPLHQFFHKPGAM